LKADLSTLRDYQVKAYNDIKAAFASGKKRVMLRAPTGAGKTRLFSVIIRESLRKRQNVWVLVPRNELMDQASEEMKEIGVPHGRIAPGYKESRNFDVHVVSKDTLIRRYGKIKRNPSFIIIDEAHLALERYIEICDMFPKAFVLGVTATPERLDGRGLSELYEVLVEGPQIADLVQEGYLSNVRYFCPPTDGLNELHRVGMDYKAEELEELLNRRHVYGKCIEHYRKHADKKPTLVFCRNLKMAEETARQFRDGGYLFESIDGKMTRKRRKALIDGVRDGRLHGLTSCELLTYGLDVPRVECIIFLRPTESKTIFFQAIGRGLRSYPGKEYCVVLDHVGNLQRHGHPFDPYTWRFFGREKAKPTSNAEIALKLCPYLDFLYCDKPSCDNCPHHPGGDVTKKRKLKVIDVELREVAPGTPLSKRPPNNKKMIQADISRCVRSTYKYGVKSPVIEEMLKIADEIGANPMWVYHKLNTRRNMVNIALLAEIAKQKNYHHWWVGKRQKELRDGGCLDEYYAMED
jgi:superfamily II DNA or RNA helicase